MSELAVLESATIAPPAPSLAIAMTLSAPAPAT
jgi:hypothetical protein